TDSILLVSGKANAWQTAKTNSAIQKITYSGKALQPFTTYFWQVKVWDKDGKPGSLSDIQRFETGMMDMKNWKGSWISDTRDIHLKPAPYFRNVFKATEKIRSARAYIAVAGLYELSVNGKTISDHRLDPMYTRFDRRNLYVTYDITQQLKAGDNAIGVLLGNGWYNHQSTAVWYFHEAPWRARPAFCMDIRITYENGSIETIVTGKKWKTSLSPVIFNSIYTAEHYDSRLEQNGWNTTSFVDSSWKDVMYRAAPSTNIVAQTLHPIRNVEKIETKTLNRIGDSVYVFDLGRNISGVAEITVAGEAGTIVRLKHAERIYANGRVDQSNIDVHYRPTDNS
ncbi:MAG: alpha-rhamnosidase, partial [Chitinophagaceae bacterium]